ncbi:hypothetical protein Salat_0204200, partial [Sesamum alatum]
GWQEGGRRRGLAIFDIGALGVRSGGGGGGARRGGEWWAEVEGWPSQVQGGKGANGLIGPSGLDTAGGMGGPFGMRLVGNRDGSPMGKEGLPLCKPHLDFCHGLGHLSPISPTQHRLGKAACVEPHLRHRGTGTKCKLRTGQWTPQWNN